MYEIPESLSKADLKGIIQDLDEEAQELQDRLDTILEAADTGDDDGEEDHDGEEGDVKARPNPDYDYE